MTPFSDNVDASMGKLRGILSSAMKDHFASSLKDAKQKALAEEVVRTILLEIETYLCDLENAVIDQISGRIQQKILDLQKDGITISSTSLQAIKDALIDASSGFSTQTSKVIDKTAEGVNNADKSNDDELKSFLEELKENDKDSITLNKDNVEKVITAKYLDSVFKDLKFFSEFLKKIEESIEKNLKPIHDVNVLLTAANNALAGSNMALAGSNMALAGSNLALSVSNIALAGSNLILSASNIVLAGSNLILAAANIALALSVFSAAAAVIASIFAATITVATTMVGLIVTVMTATVGLIATIVGLILSVIGSVAVLAASIFLGALSIALSIFGVALALAGIALSVAAVALAILAAGLMISVAIIAASIAILAAGLVVSLAVLTAGALIALSIITVALAIGILALSFGAIAIGMVLGAAIIAAGLFIAAATLGAAILIGTGLMIGGAILAVGTLIALQLAVFGAIALATMMFTGLLIATAIAGLATAIALAVLVIILFFVLIALAIFKSIESVWEMLKGWWEQSSIKKWWDGVQAKGGLWEWIKSVLKEWWDTACKWFNNLWIVKTLKTKWEELQNWWKNFSISKIVDNIKKWFIEWWNGFCDDAGSWTINLPQVVPDPDAYFIKWKLEMEPVAPFGFLKGLKIDPPKNPTIPENTEKKLMAPINNIEKNRQESNQELTYASQAMADKMEQEQKKRDYTANNATQNMDGINGKLDTLLDRFYGPVPMPIPINNQNPAAQENY